MTGTQAGTADPPSWPEATANDRTRYPAFDGSCRTDVCVVGGGYTGLSAALHLAGLGFRVVVLEARHPGWGASGRNGGQLGTGQRCDERELERRYGEAHAQALFAMAEEAKARVATLITRHGIDCDYTPGQLIVAARPSHAIALRERAAHLERRYAYGHMRFLPRQALAEWLDAPHYHGGCLDAGAAHLHPLNYCLGLARACREAGVAVHGDSPATGWQRHGERIEVHGPRGSVHCRWLVLACNAHLGALAPRIAPWIMPISSFLVATQPLEVHGRALPVRGGVCVHDTRFVVNYFRITADGRLLFGGGERWRQTWPTDIAAFVRPHLRRVFPGLATVPIDHAWGGTLAITMNRMPHLGRMAPNVYFAQGYSGHGIATATFAGGLLAEAIGGDAGRFDLWASLGVRRFPGPRGLRVPLATLGLLWYALRDRL